jgi:hypothetical protein
LPPHDKEIFAKRQLLGFAMHKNCKNAGDGQSMTAYAMFDGGNVQVKDMPKVMETMQNVKTKRLERAKAITKM